MKLKYVLYDWKNESIFKYLPIMIINQKFEQNKNILVHEAKCIYCPYKRFKINNNLDKIQNFDACEYVQKSKTKFIAS